MKSSSKSSFDLKDFLEVGYIKAAHGIRGEVFLHIYEPSTHDFNRWDSLYLNHSKTHDQKVINVESMKPHKGGYLLCVEGVKSRNDSENLKGYAVWRPKTEFVSGSGEEIYLHEIEGFLLVDLQMGQELGPIVGFSSNGAQDLLVVESNGKKVEVPFIEELTESVDFDAKKVLMNLPQGLFDENV